MPNDVRAGVEFHDRVQRFYEFDSEFRSETTLIRADKRKGRADLLLLHEEGRAVVVIEIKNTDWDRLAIRGTLRRNLLAHRRQLWRYLDGALALEPLRSEVPPALELEFLERQGALVYPSRPLTAGLDVDIEEVLAEWGLTVVWFDEPPPADSPAGEAWEALAAGTLPPRRRGGKRNEASATAR